MKVTEGSSPFRQTGCDQKVIRLCRTVEPPDKVLIISGLRAGAFMERQSPAGKSNKKSGDKNNKVGNPTIEILKTSDIDIADTGLGTPGTTAKAPNVPSIHKGRPGQIARSPRRPTQHKLNNEGWRLAGPPDEAAATSRSSGEVPAHAACRNIRSSI